MNLAQSPTCPAPSLWFVPYPFVPPAPPPVVEPVPPAAGSYRMKVLQFLNWSPKASFQDIHGAIGGENTLGATLHRMRKKGFIESTGGLNQTRYRLTVAGKLVATKE